MINTERVGDHSDLSLLPTRMIGGPWLSDFNLPELAS
jgi:hypothetical protein